MATILLLIGALGVICLFVNACKKTTIKQTKEPVTLEERMSQARRSVDEEELKTLATDPDFYVRYSCVLNPVTPVNVLLTLEEDESAMVSLHAKQTRIKQLQTIVDQLTGQEKLIGELCLPTFTGGKDDFQKMIQTIVANHPSEIK